MIGPPCVMERLELLFYNSPPGVLGSPPFPFPLGCPVKDCSGDAAWLPSHHMSDPSDPSRSPARDDGAHAILVAVGEKMLVGYGLRPENSQQV